MGEDTNHHITKAESSIRLQCLAYRWSKTERGPEKNQIQQPIRYKDLQ